LEAADEPAELTAAEAELVTEVAATLRLLNLEESDEAAEPVAVASSELMLDMDEPTPPRAEDSLEAMLERTDEPWERTELMTLVPEARALEIPLDTAEAAEETEAASVVVVWAEATAPRATTMSVVQRMLMD